MNLFLYLLKYLTKYLCSDTSDKSAVGSVYDHAPCLMHFAILYYQWLLPPSAPGVRLTPRSCEAEAPRNLATFAQPTCSSWNIWRASFTLNTCFTILKLWYKEVLNVGFCFLESFDSVRTVKLKISVHNSNLDLFQTLEISPWVLNWKLFWWKRQKTPEHRKTEVFLFILRRCGYVL